MVEDVVKTSVQRCCSFCTGGIPRFLVAYWKSLSMAQILMLPGYFKCDVALSVFPVASPSLDPAEPDVSFYVATDHRKKKKQQQN